MRGTAIGTFSTKCRHYPQTCQHKLLINNNLRGLIISPRGGALLWGESHGYRFDRVGTEAGDPLMVRRIPFSAFLRLESAAGTGVGSTPAGMLRLRFPASGAVSISGSGAVGVESRTEARGAVRTTCSCAEGETAGDVASLPPGIGIV
jgi:hypothetical protein